MLGRSAATRCSAGPARGRVASLGQVVLTLDRVAGDANGGSGRPAPAWRGCDGRGAQDRPARRLQRAPRLAQRRPGRDDVVHDDRDQPRTGLRGDHRVRKVARPLVRAQPRRVCNLPRKPQRIRGDAHTAHPRGVPGEPHYVRAPAGSCGRSCRRHACENHVIRWAAPRGEGAAHGTPQQLTERPGEVAPAALFVREQGRPDRRLVRGRRPCVRRSGLRRRVRNARRAQRAERAATAHAPARKHEVDERGKKRHGLSLPRRTHARPDEERAVDIAPIDEARCGKRPNKARMGYVEGAYPPLTRGRPARYPASGPLGRGSPTSYRSAATRSYWPTPTRWTPSTR
jgi:hypothetical protein